MKPFGAAVPLSLHVLFCLVVARPASAASVSACDEAGLRAALAGGGTVVFACDGTITLTNTLTIAANTVLDASGRNVTISGNGAVRVFQVPAGVSLSLTNLKVTDGFVRGNGGGILNQGTTVLHDCTLMGHYILGGGTFVAGAAVHSPGRLTAIGCTFAFNRAVPSNNIAVTGGAVAAAYEFFGAPTAPHGTWAFSNCTFYGNAPDAISTSQEGAVHVVNCTFAANTNAAITTRTGFHPPTVFLRNSIFLCDSAPNFPPSGAVVDAGHNLSSDASGRFTHPFSLENISPMLGPLAANGGPTLTMAPLPGSPAIDGGSNSVCPPFDQRGVARPSGPFCDIGAVEATNVVAGHGVFQIDVASYTVTEADTNLVVGVARAGGVSGAASVQFQALPGTASAGSDFAATAGTLTFAEGERAKSFVLPIKGDTLAEGAETLSLVLSNAGGGAVLGRSTAPVTILDDDINLSFGAASFSAFESVGTATITVVRTGGTAGSVSVGYFALPGTAIGSDFQSQSGVLTFAAGQTSASFAVVLGNDARAEPDETVKLKLSNPTGGASLGAIADAVLTIRDDDGTNAVLTVCDEVHLRQALAGGGVVRVACDGTITLTSGIGAIVDGGLDATDRQFRLSGGGTTPVFGVSTNARFSLKNVAVTDGVNSLGGAIQNWGALHLVSCLFSNNQTTSEINSDGGAIYSFGTLSVDGCTFVSNRCRPTSGLGSAIASGTTGAFIPGSAPGNLLITNSTFTGNGNSGSVIAYFGPAGSGLFNCTIATNQGVALTAFVQGAPVSIKNSIISGVFGGNVTDAGNNVVSGPFGPSPHPTTQTNVDPRLSPLGNHGGPTPTMVLLPGSPALGAGDNSACPPTDQRGVPRPIGSVSDVGAVESTAAGAGFPAFYFSRSDYAYPERSGIALVTVLRNGDSAAAASVDFATTASSATPGIDYVQNSGTLLFAPGQVMATFAVNLLDDATSEPSETIQETLKDPSTGNPLVPPAVAAVTILDDDSVYTIGDCNESSLRAAVALGGRVQLACDGVIVLSSPITVGNTVVLDAAGHDVTLSGNNAARLFNVASVGRLTLLNLKLSDGRARGTNGAPGTAGGAGEGGAIYNLGSVFATNCAFLRNAALGGEGGPSSASGLGPGGAAQGGVIYNSEEGTVVATSCVFEGNGAAGGSVWGNRAGLQTVAGGNGAGGVIFNAGGTVQLHQCLVLSNAVTSGLGQRYGGQGVLDAAQGGAVFSVGGKVSLTGVELSYNSSHASYFSGANGGGISQLAGLLAVTNCLFSANRVEGALGPGIGTPLGWPGGPAFGGGIYVASASGFIDSTTISDGAAVGGPAFFQPGGTGAGGGVFCGTGSELSFNNCTLAHNQAIAGNHLPTAVAAGGGICVSNGLVSFTHATIAENAVSRGSVTFSEIGLGGNLCVFGGSIAATNSIVANGGWGSNCFGAILDGGHNISSDTSCSFSASGSLNSVDPVLGPLADYGGPTPTMALLAGSPAIDAAGAASCLQLDQRGIARPFGAGCDIGAFESSPPYTILGRVTGYPAPTTGIQVTAGSVSNWVDAGGNFSLHGLSQGSHLVAPSSSEAVFVMSNRLVTLGPDLVDVTFHSYRSNAFVIEYISTGVARATFAGAASLPYRVDVSAGLSSWSPWSTNTTATSGLFEFYDTNSNPGELRVFRAVRP